MLWRAGWVAKDQRQGHRQWHARNCNCRALRPVQLQLPACLPGAARSLHALEQPGAVNLRHNLVAHPALWVGALRVLG